MDPLRIDPHQLPVDVLEARHRLLLDEIHRLGEETMEARPWRREARLVESAWYVVEHQTPLVARAMDIVRVKEEIRPEGMWNFSRGATLRPGREYTIHTVLFLPHQAGVLVEREWYVTIMETKEFTFSGLEPIYQLQKLAAAKT